MEYLFNSSVSSMLSMCPSRRRSRPVGWLNALWDLFTHWTRVCTLQAHYRLKFCLRSTRSPRFLVARFRLFRRYRAAEHRKIESTCVNQLPTTPSLEDMAKRPEWSISTCAWYCHTKSVYVTSNFRLLYFCFLPILPDTGVSGRPSTTKVKGFAP